MKGLPLILFKTFIISVIVSIALNCVYYAIVMKAGGADYGYAVPLIIRSSLYLNFIIGIMSLPMLFLYNINYWRSVQGRLLLYFSGPILFLVVILNVQMSPTTKTGHLLTGAVFLIVHSVFYYRLTRKN
jgi:hypothetical protein